MRSAGLRPQTGHPHASQFEWPDDSDQQNLSSLVRDLSLRLFGAWKAVISGGYRLARRIDDDVSPLIEAVSELPEIAFRRFRLLDRRARSTIHGEIDLRMKPNLGIRKMIWRKIPTLLRGVDELFGCSRRSGRLMAIFEKSDREFLSYAVKL